MATDAPTYRSLWIESHTPIASLDPSPMLTLSIAVAFRAFFAALFDAQRSESIRLALEPAAFITGGAIERHGPPGTVEKGVTEPTQPRGATVAAPTRSEALTLLAMLQREARLVDLIQEPLEQYSDAQVGAAARPCLTQCRSTLARAFELQSVINQTEGTSVELPEVASPLRFQWVGDATPEQKRGRLVHPGWQAGRCELAHWTGAAEDHRVIAPAQIES